MSFSFHGDSFADDSSHFAEGGATHIFLALESSIVASPMRSFQYPSTLDQIRYTTFYRVGDEIFHAEENAEQPNPEEGWRRIDDDNDIWFHSKWAANFARYLDVLRVCGHIGAWRYQPQTFPIDGIQSGYTPDFKVI